ncbi:unnamed protein product [Pleuronectes platessa]|uniref:Uncharacterized protein n=1 Tax=Pleuronectes platessa TaxID=8262 RepID=A0A9N7UTZ2_PLEPL|nr:unnamed protein product [Pleuronectes platessa]
MGGFQQVGEMRWLMGMLGKRQREGTHHPGLDVDFEVTESEASWMVSSSSRWVADTPQTGRNSCHDPPCRQGRQRGTWSDETEPHPVPLSLARVVPPVLTSVWDLAEIPATDPDRNTLSPSVSSFQQVCSTSHL